ncbi:MAG: hypothetical protein ACI92A_001666, partial [Candidatus Paceibacteria bacterium]
QARAEDVSIQSQEHHRDACFGVRPTRLQSSDNHQPFQSRGYPERFNK